MVYGPAETVFYNMSITEKERERVFRQSQREIEREHGFYLTLGQVKKTVETWSMFNAALMSSKVKKRYRMTSEESRRMTAIREAKNKVLHRSTKEIR